MVGPIREQFEQTISIIQTTSLRQAQQSVHLYSIINPNFKKKREKTLTDKQKAIYKLDQI